MAVHVCNSTIIITSLMSHPPPPHYSVTVIKEPTVTPQWILLPWKRSYQTHQHGDCTLWTASLHSLQLLLGFIIAPRPRIKKAGSINKTEFQPRLFSRIIDWGFSFIALNSRKENSWHICRTYISCHSVVDYWHFLRISRGTHALRAFKGWPIFVMNA